MYLYDVIMMSFSLIMMSFSLIMWIMFVHTLMHFVDHGHNFCYTLIFSISSDEACQLKHQVQELHRQIISIEDSHKHQLEESMDTLTTLRQAHREDIAKAQDLVTIQSMLLLGIQQWL